MLIRTNSQLKSVSLTERYATVTRCKQDDKHYHEYPICGFICDSAITNIYALLSGKKETVIFNYIVYKFLVKISKPRRCVIA